jgi:hypothetical protein
MHILARLRKPFILNCTRELFAGHLTAKCVLLLVWGVVVCGQRLVHILCVQVESQVFKPVLGLKRVLTAHNEGTILLVYTDEHPQPSQGRVSVPQRHKNEVGTCGPLSIPMLHTMPTHPDDGKRPRSDVYDKWIAYGA